MLLQPLLAKDRLGLVMYKTTGEGDQSECDNMPMGLRQIIFLPREAAMKLGAEADLSRTL